MRRLLFRAAVIVGGVWGGFAPATATPLAISGLNSPNVGATPVEEVGYWRRQYRRHGYPVPYVYYPPRMATMRLRPPTPTIHPHMATIRLRPPMATIHPPMATMATIRPRMATNHSPPACVCEPGGSAQC
jgi:hypothetical protein